MTKLVHINFTNFCELTNHTVHFAGLVHTDFSKITKFMHIKVTYDNMAGSMYQHIMNHDSGFIIGIAHVFLQKL